MSTDDSDLPLTMGHLRAFAQGLTRRLRAGSAEVNAQAEKNGVRAELTATLDDMRREQIEKLRSDGCPESLVRMFEVSSVRLKVEQDQLVSGIGRFWRRAIRLQGACNLGLLEDRDRQDL